MVIRKWTTSKSSIVLDTPWIRVRKDRCSLPSGRDIPDFYVWEGHDFVQIFAITKEMDVVLVQQYRQALGAVVIELPAGIVEKGERLVEAAARELREETGFWASSWDYLAGIHVHSAKSGIRNHIFLAMGAEKASEPSLDRHEEIEVLTWPLGSFYDVVQSDIKDAGSIAATYLAMEELKKRRIL